MSLEFAILGFLQYKPLSGYDLKKMLDSSIHHFWPADQSHIYRTLSLLERKALVRSELILQYSKPNSKIYYITDEGKTNFREWLETPINQVEIRLSWLIQLFFASSLEDEKIVEMLEQFLNQLKEKRDAYINPVYKFSGNDILSKRDKFFRELTYDYGIAINYSIQKWLDKTISRIKNHEYEIGVDE